MVHAVMLQQPIALAGVGGEHGRLVLDNGTHINAKRRLDGASERVLAFDGVAIIQVGNLRQGRRVIVAGEEVRRRCAEHGSPHQGACHFVVEHVIGRAVRQDEARPHRAEQARDALQRRS